MASRATAYRPMVASERRDDVRFDAQVTRAKVRGLKPEPVPAALSEISIYGCRITCDVVHEMDESVLLRLDGSLPIAAKVVWNRDGVLGCRFDTPIGRPLMRSLMNREELKPRR